MLAGTLHAVAPWRGVCGSNIPSSQIVWCWVASSSSFFGDLVGLQPAPMLKLLRKIWFRRTIGWMEWLTPFSRISRWNLGDFQEPFVLQTECLKFRFLAISWSSWLDFVVQWFISSSHFLIRYLFPEGWVDHGGPWPCDLAHPWGVVSGGGKPLFGHTRNAGLRAELVAHVPRRRSSCRVSYSGVSDFQPETQKYHLVN